jgi:hypothetical protein
LSRKSQRHQLAFSIAGAWPLCQLYPITNLAPSLTFWLPWAVILSQAANRKAQNRLRLPILQG